MTIIIPLAIWLLAQGSKFVYRSYRDKKITLLNFLDYGGMPSSHAVLVSGLATTVGMREGIRSTAFGLTAIFALFIIHDALRLRNVVQEHSKILNGLRTNGDNHQSYPPTTERVGHRPTEVIAGIMLGVIGTLGLMIFFK